MFLPLFRSHANLQLIFFLLLSLLLWADGFIFPVTPKIGSDETFVFTTVHRLLSFSPFVSVILAFLLILAEALLLNDLLANSGITLRNNYLPAFLFVLVYSWNPSFLCLHPVMLSNLFLILALRMLWKSFQKEESYQEILTASLFLAITAWINIYNIILLPLIWISLIINRSTNWREWFIPLIGFSIPLIFAAFYFFWNSLLMEKIAGLTEFFKNLRLFQSGYSYPLIYYLIFSWVSIIAVVAFFKFITSLSEKIISIRKISQVVVWLFILSAPVFFLIKEEPVIVGSTILVPVSVFFSAWLQSAKKIWFYEIVLWILIAGIIAAKIVCR